MDDNAIEIEMKDLQAGDDDAELASGPRSSSQSLFRDKGYSGLNQSADADIGGPAEPGSWTRSRIRSQNRCMILALTVFLIASVMYIGRGVYMSDEEVSSLVEPFESESGTVTNDAQNEKAQQTLDEAQNVYSDNHSKNKQSHFGGNKNPFADKVSHASNQKKGSIGGNKVVAGHGGTLGKLNHGGGQEKVHGQHHVGGGGKQKDQAKGKNGAVGIDQGQEVESVVDESEPYCEDLSPYSQWMQAKVTKQDGAMFRVVRKMNHDPKAFTQGLTYARGHLYESTGLYGESTVRILNRTNAHVVKSVPIDKSLFGEGLAYCKDTLVQITWKSQRGFVYNVTNLELLDEFKFTTTNNEGWGITWDRCKDEIIVTDGSANLHFWDPETMKEKRKLPVVRMNGVPATKLNEIEYWRGRILANVWYEDVLLVINPENGEVEKEYDFASLWPENERIHGADCFNGISVSNKAGVLYVTGKKWDRIYAIELLP